MPNAVLYGFYNLRDHLDLSLAESNLEPRVIETAIQNSVAYHTRQLDRAMDLFVFPTEEFLLKYRSRTGTRNQGIDEIGSPVPIRIGYTEYEQGLPFRRSANGWGIDWETRQRITPRVINDTLAEILTGDRIWTKDQILSAMFQATDWTFPDPDHGNLTVKPLANGDSVLYVKRGTYVTATDNHFHAQAAGIADATNPFADARADLVEHPENTGPVIHFIPDNLVASAQALSTFYTYRDDNLIDSSEPRLVGQLTGIDYPGELIGYDEAGGGSWIVNWPEMPSDYIISITRDGTKPLAMRQDPVRRLRGFFLVQEIDGYPWYKQDFRRHVGFGAWNRVGAVVTRVGNGTYAVPAGLGRTEV